MKLYKSAYFGKWASEHALSGDALRVAICEMHQGVLEASLGGHVYKKRIAIGNKGKSGGARTIIAFKQDERAFFMYGFAKNKRANISKNELAALKKLAKTYLNLTAQDLQREVQKGQLIPILEE